MDLYLNDKNDRNIFKAQHLEPVDCVPVTFSDQLDFLGGWLNFDRHRYHLDAATTLNAQVAFNQRFQGTGILGPNFGVVLEPSAFGAEIMFSKENPPWVLEGCSNLDDFDDYVTRLKDPNPLFSGHLPAFYQAYFHMKSLCGASLGAPLGVIGAFDIASLLVGMANLCLALRLMPEAAHRLLGKINRFLINFIETKANLFGVQSIELLDIYNDNSAYLSRNDYQEFILPYNKSIYDYFSNETTTRLFHCDGEMPHLIDLIPQMGVNCLYSFDAHTDLQLFVESIGDKVCLIGNIDPIRVLRNGTKDMVAQEVKRLLEIGKNAKGFILSSGGELANGTPAENIDAVLETVESFGKY